MAVTLQEIRHIASLARLKLSSEEEQALLKDMNKILEYIDQLKEIDLSGIEETSHVIASDTPFREDIVGDTLSVEEALANAPETKGHFFKVPRVIKPVD